MKKRMIARKNNRRMQNVDKIWNFCPFTMKK